MQIKTDFQTRTHRPIRRLTLALSLGTAAGILAALIGCGPVLEALAVKITGIPLPTSTPRVTVTGTVTTTPGTTATTTPFQQFLFNTTIVGNTAVTLPAPYPSGFFTPSYDITNNGTGTGTITPFSATAVIQVQITATSSTSRPQIQFQFTGTQNQVYLAPQNTSSNILFTNFVPNTTRQLSFSVIDTGTAASRQSYTIQIVQ